MRRSSHRHARLAAAATLAGSTACAAQVVPGFEVSLFSSPPSPNLLATGAHGVLFAGRDDAPSGSITAVPVARIMPDGSSSSYGGPILDPDALVLDSTGIVSGVPNAVLVGGLISEPNGSGRVTVIRPDQSMFTLFEAAEFGNISELKFDAAGSLHFVSVTANKIFKSSAGETPTALCPTGAACIHLAIAPDGRLFTSNAAGTIRINAADGTLLDASFAQFNGRVAIEFAEGGGFGSDLLALERDSGTLYTVSAGGVKTVIGTGFGTSGEDIAIGSCGAVYVSLRSTSQVLRIRQALSADFDESGVVDGSDLGELLGQWGPCPCCPADFDADGVVDGSDLGDLLGQWGPAS